MRREQGSRRPSSLGGDRQQSQQEIGNDVAFLAPPVEIYGDSGRNNGSGRGAGGWLDSGDRIDTRAPLDQPVDRILTSLDRLGERIRALSANREDQPTPFEAPRATAATAQEAPSFGESPRPRAPEASSRRVAPPPGVDLQRAIEEIARKRDALDRPRPEREPERFASERPSRSTFDRADPFASEQPIADRRSAAALDDMRGEIRDIKRTIERFESQNASGSLSDIGRRIEMLNRSVADGRSVVVLLREEVAMLREAVLETTAASPIKALTATYDEILRRLDEMHGAIDNPSTMAEVVQRLGDVRRMLGGMITEAQAGAILGRIDGIADRLEGTVDKESLGALQVQIVSLAQTVSGLDQTKTVSAIETSLGAVIDQLSAIDQRLTKLGDVERLQENIERNNATLSQLAQRAEQLPRVAHEMERQSASVEGLVKTTEALPRMAADIEALRQAMDPAETARTIDQLGNRVEGLAEKIETLAPPADLSERFTEITDRLAHLAQKTEALPKVAQAIERHTETIERQTNAIEAQAETVETIVRTVDTLPRLVADVTEIRRTLETADPQRGIDQVIIRIDDLNARIERMASSGDLISDGGIELRLAEIARRLDKLELRPGTPGLIHLEERLTQLASAIDEKIATGAAAALPDAAAATLARIEQQLVAPVAGERFAALEDRIADLTRVVEQMDRRSGPDVAKIERTLSDLRGELAILSVQSPLDIDRELRALTDRIDRLTPPELMDPVVYGRIEERIATLVDKLDNRPTEAGLLADALGRFETLLAEAVAPDRLAAATLTGRGADDTRESLAQIHSELASLQDDLRNSAHRDRELLAAISDAVERLAAREPSAASPSAGRLRSQRPPRTLRSSTRTPTPPRGGRSSGPSPRTSVSAPAARSKPSKPLSRTSTGARASSPAAPANRPSSARRRSKSRPPRPRWSPTWSRPRPLRRPFRPRRRSSTSPSSRPRKRTHSTSTPRWSPARASRPG